MTQLFGSAPSAKTSARDTSLTEESFNKRKQQLISKIGEDLPKFKDPDLVKSANELKTVLNRLTFSSNKRDPEKVLQFYEGFWGGLKRGRQRS